MKKIVLALTLITMVTLLTSASAAAYYFSVNESYQAETSSSAASPAPDVSSSPTTTPTSTPSSSNTSTPPPSLTIPTPAPATTPSSNLTSNPTGIHVSRWNPPSDTNTTIVIINSPTNNTIYTTDNLTLNVNAGTKSTDILNLYLGADWLEKGIQLFNHLSTDNGNSFPFLATKGISVTLALTGIPKGHHSLTVTANANSDASGSSSVNFTIE